MKSLVTTLPSISCCNHSTYSKLQETTIKLLVARYTRSTAASRCPKLIAHFRTTPAKTALNCGHSLTSDGVGMKQFISKDLLPSGRRAILGEFSAIHINNSGSAWGTLLQKRRDWVLPNASVSQSQVIVDKVTSGTTGFSNYTRVLLYTGRHWHRDKV